MSESVECTCSKQESYFPIPWGGGGGGGCQRGLKSESYFPIPWGRGGQRGLKSTIHASLAVKSTIHMLSYTKSKSTHTKFKNEEGKPKNTIFKVVCEDHF